MKQIDAVLEIAGGDSFAAAAAFAKNNPGAALLPTYVHTGTEYGEFSVIERHVKRLSEDLKDRFGASLEPMEVLSEPALWRAINGRFMSTLRDRYGFYTPCIGCHLYLHLMRIPVALKRESLAIVAGEREVHASGRKVNQTPALLDAYQSVVKAAGPDLVLPVRRVETREELSRLIPWMWDEGAEQLSCVLSGNYRDLQGNPVLYVAGAEMRFIREFLEPAGKTLALMLARGERGYEAAVKKVLET